MNLMIDETLHSFLSTASKLKSSSVSSQEPDTVRSEVNAPSGDDKKSFKHDDRT